jgi:uncharacterized membrane protein
MGVVRKRRVLTAEQLNWLAVVLGLVALVGWIRFAGLLDDQPFWSREQALWLGASVLAGTYSAACLVLSGLKNRSAG